MRTRSYFVYIMTNTHNTVTYTGITNDLYRRITEHKQGSVKGFTQRYNINKLVYYEVTEDCLAAIAREKQIKAWTRQKKNDLITQQNPEWQDLYNALYSVIPSEARNPQVTSEGDSSLRLG